MPRIRSIKPDYWSDEKIVELSIPCRLFFIGTWNIADDSGTLQYSTKQIKMRIFPADPIDIQPLIDELLATGLVIEYEVDGKKYLNIKNFTKHQVINKPSKTRLPLPPTTGVLPDGREVEVGSGSRKGKEGNGREGSGEGRETESGGNGLSAIPPDSDERRKAEIAEISARLISKVAKATH